MDTVNGQIESTLNKEKHIKYWLRCLKTYLPHPYTSNDSNRMTLAFFTLSALDLLGVLEDHTTEAERQDYANWIYHCQRPLGGFRGFPATDFGDLTSDGNILWDPANLPATFFALSTLIILGDDLQRLKRREILEWLPSLQRDNGGFGETVGEAGKVEGGTDSRFGYMAAGVRWMLRGRGGQSANGIVDIDVDRFVSCIGSSETYDGGISEAPFLEAHAGLTYCAIGALSFVDRLPPAIQKRKLGMGRMSTADLAGVTGLKSLEDTVHWLVSRQTPSVMDDDNEDADSEIAACPASDHHAHTTEVLHRISAVSGESSAKDLNKTPSPEGLRWAGFNGRCNKIPDTCYSWWVGGSLQILNRIHLIDLAANRRYLLEHTQHMIGGFGKVFQAPPDIMHSYLGLAALALMKEPGLRSIDSTLCVSLKAREHLESLPWWVGNGVTDEQGI